MGYIEDLLARIAGIKQQGQVATQNTLEQVSQQNALKSKQQEEAYSGLTQQVNTQAADQQNQQMAYVEQARQRAAQQRKLLAAQQTPVNTDFPMPQFAQPKPAAIPDPVMNPAGPSRSGPVGKNFDSFMQAISKQESGGNYGAVNKDTGASGKYQIMPSNIGPWAREALGKNVSVSQFRNSPQIQEAIAKNKLKEYYNKYGAQGAAIAWYAGPGAAEKFVRSGQSSNRSEGKYPTVTGYAAQVLKKMGL